jgi:hypothetical protein
MTARTARRVALGVVVGLVLAAVAVVLGVAWYFAGVALAVDNEPGSAVPVRSVDGEAYGISDGGRAVTLPRTDATTTAGLHAVRHPGGWGIMDSEVGGGDEDVVRAWQDVDGTLATAPVDGVVDSDVYLGSPAAVGLPHEDVVVTSDVGDLPTWFVPAPAMSEQADTWVVFVHGRTGSREEALRYLPIWHDLGHPVLVAAYRNDVGAPSAQNGFYGLGETEWRDVDAAMRYALDNGAERVILAGWSMGGAIVLQALDRSEHAEAVAALVLDAPVLDWRDTLGHQGSVVGLPPWWTSIAIGLVEVRGDLDFDDYDWVARAADLPTSVPIYVVHSDDDSYVPNGPSVALADARPDVVTLVRPAGAEHTREWNVDPEGYEARMRAWFGAALQDRPERAA